MSDYPTQTEIDKNKDFRAMAQELADHEDPGMTDWEVGFIEGVLAQRTMFTERQRTIITRIWQQRLG